MKRFSFTLGTLCLSAALLGCGGGATESTESGSTPPAEESESEGSDGGSDTHTEESEEAAE